ncbi:hypothetical protein JCM30760_03860 [Thiomicrorhabdus hydrogeniphila]
MKTIFLVIFTVLISNQVFAKNQTIDLDSTSINIEIVQATSPKDTFLTPKARIVWLPSEYGVLPQEKAIAHQLAKHGIETWFPDFYEAMFLAPTPSAVDKVNPLWTEQIIKLAQNKSDVPIWIIAPNRSAQLAVKGVQTLFTRPGKNMGLILINPNLYIKTPAPGLTAEYWPETNNINLPITIIQSELSPWKFNVANLSQRLSVAGSNVFTQLITNVRDRFYFRPDALPIEQAKAQKLANHLRQAMQMQLPYMAKQRTLHALVVKPNKHAEKKKSTGLASYQGAQNVELKLNDMLGTQHNIKDYKGKVVLVNFWASWCPPCVHEMPSMARLKSHFNHANFEILAANLGEDAGQVKAFLKEHPVNFPVLLDKGTMTAKQWKVFAYPSSYLIDKNGKIRFALFGGTEWDDPEHIKVINSLLNDS